MDTLTPEERSASVELRGKDTAWSPSSAYSWPKLDANRPFNAHNASRPACEVARPRGLGVRIARPAGAD